MLAAIVALLIVWLIVAALGGVVRVFLWLAVIVILAVFLSGCSSRPASPDLSRVDAALAVRPAIPQDLLTCKPEPRSPGGDATDSTAARYVIDVVDAGRDCRRKLGAIRNVTAK